MVVGKQIYKHPLLLMLVAFIVASVAVSCGSNPEIDRRLTKAEKIMEQHPDSAYMLLNGIDKETLSTKKEKARYALLMSMALDKNYIDTTTFDVLQPAIDYYLDNGTPDEKLRTYYYRGRIFQNREDYGNAMSSFIKGISLSQKCNDSLTIARTLVAQACIYQDFYDFKSYTESYLNASRIFKLTFHKDQEFECILNALNGAILLNDKAKADSLINICENFGAINDRQKQTLQNYTLSYAIEFGTKEEIENILYNQLDTTNLNLNTILDLALAHNKLGENNKAIQLLDAVDRCGEEYDTLKYQAISVFIYEDIGDYKNAFSTYIDFSSKVESTNVIKSNLESKFIEEKLKIEIQAEKESKQKLKIIWGCIGIVMLLSIIILAYSLYVKRIKIEHANDLVQIRNLRDNLFETGKQQEEMSNRIEKLFGTRFKLLDGLASSYFECRETGQEQKRIYADVKNSLNDFSSDTATQELTDVVNGYKNGLMEHFKADYPKLSASQYRLALYLFCGFSLPSISIFIGTDLRNIYVYKSRLKSIISKSETPRKEEYLKYFA